MRVSSIPAQVTTVEDRIAGNLNITQLILLAAPLFITALMFFILPPIGKFNIYKLCCALAVTIPVALLAIRYNERLLLDILRQRITYKLRPHIYILAKSSSTAYDPLYLDQQFYNPLKSKPAMRVAAEPFNKEYGQHASRKYGLDFSVKKGGLNVKVTIPS